jgi:hypothetical protein
MLIDYKAQDFEMPAELRNSIYAAMDDLRRTHMDRLNTPVPGNKQGGFPGIDFSTMKAEILDTRRSLIDAWNAEHGDE